MSILQLIFNKLSNTLIDKLSNKIVYEFKFREKIHVIVNAITKSIFIDIKLNVKLQLIVIEIIKFRYRIKIVDVNFYVNAKFKIQYNFKQILLLLKLNNKTFLRLYHKYILSNKFNKKIFN